jgi:hypothetical protein
MQGQDLKCYWIDPHDPRGPIGFGVTAFSREDAFSLIEHLGYRLPDDQQSLIVTESVRFDALDPHVQRNMGPMAVRGLWYPFWIVGVPDW